MPNKNMNKNTEKRISERLVFLRHDATFVYIAVQRRVRPAITKGWTTRCTGTYLPIECRIVAAGLILSFPLLKRIFSDGCAARLSRHFLPAPSQQWQCGYIACPRCRVSIVRCFAIGSPCAAYLSEAVSGIDCPHDR